MAGSKPPPKRTPRDATVPDPVLTRTLAERVKRDVALEKASEGSDADEHDEGAAVVIVLGPDGVPQIADAVDKAPATVRYDLEESDEEKKTKKKR